MIIQSKKVWIADQFFPAQIEMEGEKIKNIYDYGTKEVATAGFLIQIRNLPIDKTDRL